MHWYYDGGGQAVGPRSGPEIEALVASGLIGPSTLMWRRGMTGWVKRSEIPDFVAGDDSLLPPAGDALADPSALPPGGDVSSAVPPPSAEAAAPLVLSGGFRRYVARGIDLAVASAALHVAIVISTGWSVEASASMNAFGQLLYVLAIAPVWFVMTGLIVAATGNSLGKRTLGIKAVPLNEPPASPLRASIRRELSVWLIGTAAMLPFVSFIVQIIMWRRVATGRPTPYDAGRWEVRLVALPRRERLLAGLIGIVCIAGNVAWTMLEDGQAFKAHLSNWTNPETGMNVELPEGWGSLAVDRSSDLPVYNFVRSSDGHVIALMNEAVPDAALEDYAAAMQATMDGYAAFEDQWTASEAGRFLRLTGRTRAADQPTAIFLARNDATFWRLIVLPWQGSLDPDTERLIARLFASAGIDGFRAESFLGQGASLNPTAPPRSARAAMDRWPSAAPDCPYRFGPFRPARLPARPPTERPPGRWLLVIGSGRCGRSPWSAATCVMLELAPISSSVGLRARLPSGTSVRFTVISSRSFFLARVAGSGGRLPAGPYFRPPR